MCGDNFQALEFGSESNEPYPAKVLDVPAAVPQGSARFPPPPTTASGIAQQLSSNIFTERLRLIIPAGHQRPDMHGILEDRLIDPSEQTASDRQIELQKKKERCSDVGRNADTRDGHAGLWLCKDANEPQYASVILFRILFQKITCATTSSISVANHSFNHYSRHSLFQSLFQSLFVKHFQSFVQSLVSITLNQPLLSKF